MFRMLPRLSVMALCAAALFAAPSEAATKSVAGYGKLPLAFEANQGQTDERVKFLSRGRGYSLFLTESEVVLSLGGKSTLQVRLEGAVPAPKMTGLDRLPGISNYFIGRDRSKWRTGVPHYAKVGYEGVYPGIDLVFYGTKQRQLEFDFVIAPGADPGAIGLGFEGAERLEIDEAGDLIAHLPGGEVRFLKPVIYQEADGAKQPVEGGYVLKDGRVTFDLAAYDPAKPLVIDPVLKYATYLGGTDLEESIRSLAVDGAGNAYVVGQTRSPDFPLVGEFQQTCTDTADSDDCHDAFVAKLDATGSTLLYSTYLGGTSVETAWGIAVDANGNAYVVGSVAGGDTGFPTTGGAFQETAVSDRRNTAFFVKLNATGGLEYSTYLGGSGGETAWDIAVDSQGRGVIVGSTGSSDFPVTPGAFDEICGDDFDASNCGDAFLTVIKPAGAGDADLVYSTFLGGSDGAVAAGVAVDGSNVAYVAGYTSSQDFPTTDGSFQSIAPPPAGKNNAFVSVIDPSATGTAGLVYSSYLGGDDGSTIGRDVAVNPICSSGCDVYLTGNTNADDFPTSPGAIAPLPVQGFDTFVTVIDTDTGTPDPADDLVYSTYFGGKGGWGIAVDDTGAAYVTGGAFAAYPLPTRDEIQAEHGGSACEDAFVAVIDPAGNGLEEGLLFATYLGGTGCEAARAVAVDDLGDVYVAGRTHSRDFPTTEGAFQTEIAEPKKRGKPSTSLSASDSDAFIAKIEGPFEGTGLVDPFEPKPVAVADAYETVEDTPLSVPTEIGLLANDSNPNGRGLTVINYGNPGDGTVIGETDGSFTYTPDADFFGTDSFKYSVSDGLFADQGIVTIEVTGTNDAPVARDDLYFVADATVPFVVSAPGVLGNDEDVDGDELTAILISGPSNGTVFLMPDGGFTYTANDTFSGTDTFSYRAKDDSEVESDIAIVTLFKGDTIHIGDLDPSSSGFGSAWNAKLWVRVHDGAHKSVADATVTVSVDTTNFTSGELICTTGFTGRCTVSVDGIPKRVQSVTFTVQDVTRLPSSYEEGANHDPDGDSNGTSVVVSKP